MGNLVENRFCFSLGFFDSYNEDGFLCGAMKPP